MITPTYEEGIRRGIDEEAQRQTIERLIAVFDRDASHTETLLGMARDVRRALGTVAHCERQDVAAHFASQLVTELDALVDYYTDEATEKRVELRALVNGEQVTA